MDRANLTDVKLKLLVLLIWFVLNNIKRLVKKLLFDTFFVFSNKLKAIFFLKIKTQLDQIFKACFEVNKKLVENIK